MTLLLAVEKIKLINIFLLHATDGIGNQADIVDNEHIYALGCLLL